MNDAYDKGFMDKIAKLTPAEAKIIGKWMGGASGILGSQVALSGIYKNLPKRDYSIKDRLQDEILRTQGKLKGNVDRYQTLPEYSLDQMRKAKVPKKVIKYNQKRLKRIAKKIRKSGKLDMAWAFDPKNKAVIQGMTGKGTPGILAHELGHSEQKFIRNPVGRGLYGVGVFGPQILAGLIAGGGGVSLGKALGLGFGLASPALLTEMDASRRGSKLLKKYTDENPAASWLGVPSYATVAALPAVAVGGRKYVGPKMIKLLKLLKKVK